MKKVFSLVQIGRDTFIMLNAKENLTNRQCNSTMFESQEIADLNVNIFDYFELKVHIVIEKLDRRTKKFKELERQYPYFSAGFLPMIQKRARGNSLINFDYRKL
jgi:hypothetical protein